LTLVPKLTPLVSVVIPAYNRRDCIERAVASIQRQTHENWEALVVDDGSTDGTRGLVETLARRDSRIRLIRHERNRGAQAARNSGIDTARGEWIAFLDSDDTWLPQSLEVRLRLAREEQVLVVHSGGDVLQGDGVTKSYFVPPMAGYVYGELLQREGPLFQGLLVAKQALRQIGGLDARIAAFQEWDTALSLAKHYRFGFVPESTFVYDCRRTDTMSKQFRNAGVGYEQVFHKRYLDIWWTAGPGALATHYRRAEKWYEAAGSRSQAWRCALLARVWSCVDVRTAVQSIRGRFSSLTGSTGKS
jgi:glycosyltransferase involved in cell wall biosynthesis